jgi:hypothetical protein
MVPGFVPGILPLEQAFSLLLVVIKAVFAAAPKCLETGGTTWYNLTRKVLLGHGFFY